MSDVKGLRAEAEMKESRCWLRYPRARGVALALDGADPALALLRDQVDAGIRAVETRPGRRPLGPQPDFGEAVAIERILLEIRLHQPLEQAALLDFGAGDGPDVIEYALEAVGHRLIPLCLRSFACRIGLAEW